MIPDISKTLDRLEFLFAIAHSPESLLASFAREADRLGTDTTRLWHLWFTYWTGRV